MLIPPISIRQQWPSGECDSTQSLQASLFSFVNPLFCTPFLICLLLFAGVTSGESALGAGKISKIEIEGQRKIDVEAIRAKIQSALGETVDQKKISEDVKRIFALGYFKNIQVSKVNRADGDLELKFKVFEKPSMSEIKFLGNSDQKEEDLLDASGVKPYEILDYQKLNTAVEKLSKFYEEKGYFLARISYEVQETESADAVKVNFIVSENEKVKVKRITLVGNYRISDTEIKTKLFTREDGFFSFLSGSGSYRQDAFERDVQIVSMVYFNKGFVQAKVDRPQVYITPDKKSIYITIRVEEGEQFGVGEVNFSGDLLFTSSELEESVNLDGRDIFSSEVLRSDIESLQAKYGDLGYAFANIIPQTRVREQERLVDITFEIDKGEKVYLGRIQTKGNTKTRDKVVRRELRIAEGELYNETRKRKSEGNVKRLGYFDDVAFTSKTFPDDPSRMDLDIVVKERNTGQIIVGAGYSSFQGAVFQGQIQQQNFLGRGQSIGLNFQVSKVNSIFNVSFTEPYVYDTLWSFGANAYRTENRYNEFTDTRLGASVTVGHPLAEDLIASLRYRNDYAQIDLAKADLQEIYPVETTNGRTSSVTAIIDYDKRNDRMFPSDGYYLSASHEYAGLGGEIYFNKSLATARYYRPLIWDLVLRTNFTYGSISPAGNRAPPFNELFRLGSDRTLRGFNWFSIGRKKVITNPASDSRGLEFVFGGRQQAYYNLELEFPVISEAGIKGVLFYDSGYADDEITFEDFRSNYGMGFRWFSPLGPLRFEWGIPINPQRNEGTNFIFSIGAPF